MSGHRERLQANEEAKWRLIRRKAELAKELGAVKAALLVTLPFQEYGRLESRRQEIVAALVAADTELAPLALERRLISQDRDEDLKFAVVRDGAEKMRAFRGVCDGLFEYVQFLEREVKWLRLENDRLQGQQSDPSGEIEI